MGPAFFAGARFSDLAEFKDCHFPAGVDFKESDFGIDATFCNTSFGQQADFTASNFLGFADFCGSNFACDADFSNSGFRGPADFSRATFSEKINLHDAQFRKNVHFESSKINKINLTQTRYEWLFLKWNSINHLDFDDGAYQTLIDNYKKLQWQADSSDCSSTYLEAIVQAAPNDSHLWIINGIRSLVLGTNSSSFPCLI